MRNNPVTALTAQHWQNNQTQNVNLLKSCQDGSAPGRVGASSIYISTHNVLRLGLNVSKFD